MIDKRSVRVSYIIATRNRADYLDRALSNVAEFITPDDELLIIDGASTDHTAQVVDKHRKIVTYFQSEPDFGEAHAFNKGMLIASGKYIKWIADDDYFYPDAMQFLVDVMEKNPDLDAVVCGGESVLYNSDETSFTVQGFNYLPLDKTVPESFELVLCGLGLIFRQTMIARVGLLDTSFRAVDNAYFAKLLISKVNFKYLNIKLFRHNGYAHSNSNVLSEMDRDHVRMYLITRNWEMVTKCSFDGISDALGLSRLPSGKDLAIIIWLFSKIRQYNHYLWLIISPITLLGRFRDSFGRNIRTSASPSVEPVWDGSLH